MHWRRRQAHNPEAYDAYLQGRYYWNLFTPATTRKAIECYLAGDAARSELCAGMVGSGGRVCVESDPC